MHSVRVYQTQIGVKGKNMHRNACSNIKGVGILSEEATLLLLVPFSVGVNS